VRSWRIVEATLLIISTISFCLAIYLSDHFVNTRPKMSELLNGRVYIHSVHGQIAYLNQQEKIALNALFWVAGVGFVLGISIDRYTRYQGTDHG